jgi:hypothetical protein
MLNSVAASATAYLDRVPRCLDSIPSYGQGGGAYDQIARDRTRTDFTMGVSSAVFQAGNVAGMALRHTAGAWGDKSRQRLHQEQRFHPRG